MVINRGVCLCVCFHRDALVAAGSGDICEGAERYTLQQAKPKPVVVLSVIIDMNRLHDTNWCNVKILYSLRME